MKKNFKWKLYFFRNYGKSLIKFSEWIQKAFTTKVLSSMKIESFENFALEIFIFDTSPKRKAIRIIL